VLPWWEGADEAQSRCSFSNHLIRYGECSLVMGLPADRSVGRKPTVAGCNGPV
jgi:hypothetical protein